VTGLLHVFLPATRPTAFLAVVGLCFAWSGVAAVVITVIIRLTFRRGKGLEDL
jgi:hypothetical protein